jgi:multisubunit Na+/H+ antiporter MnhF subunit
MIAFAYTTFCVLAGAGMLCSLWRLWRGPTVGDRINAADVTALCAVGLALGHGWWREDPLWLDVALVAGLVLFVGTTAVALLLNSEELSGSGD